jgi:hypothetical protein
VELHQQSLHTSWRQIPSSLCQTASAHLQPPPPLGCCHDCAPPLHAPTSSSTRLPQRARESRSRRAAAGASSRGARSRPAVPWRLLALCARVALQSARTAACARFTTSGRATCFPRRVQCARALRGAPRATKLHTCKRWRRARAECAGRLGIKALKCKAQKNRSASEHASRFLHNGGINR